MTGQDNEHARFALDDAAYLLGALDEVEAAAFEQHLAGCELCQASIAELTELPPLLGIVSTADLAELEPPPDTLLPRLLREVKASRRKRAWRTAAVSFAAACVLAVLALAGVHQYSDSHRPQPLAMQAVGPASADVHATVTLTGSGKKTRIELDCGYHAVANYPTGTGPSYRMVVFNRLGQMRDLGSWMPAPGEDVRIDRNSPWSRQNISKIEVSTDDGVTLLRLNL